MTDLGSENQDRIPFAVSRVESLYEDYLGLVGDLSGSSPSGLAALNRSYHKVLLVAAASSLEAQVKQIVKSFFTTEGRMEFGTFVEKTVMARHYHTLFNWDGGKATGFFTSFGEVSVLRFKMLLAEDDDFKREHDAFMRLGSLRNQLVHQDYASFSLDDTPEELISLYRSAVRFPEKFEEIIFWDSDG